MNRHTKRNNQDRVHRRSYWESKYRGNRFLYHVPYRHRNYETEPEENDKVEEERRKTANLVISKLQSLTKEDKNKSMKLLLCNESPALKSHETVINDKDKETKRIAHIPKPFKPSESPDHQVRKVTAQPDAYYVKPNKSLKENNIKRQVMKDLMSLHVNELKKFVSKSHSQESNSFLSLLEKECRVSLSNALRKVAEHKLCSTNVNNNPMLTELENLVDADIAVDVCSMPVETIRVLEEILNLDLDCDIVEKLNSTASWNAHANASDSFENNIETKRVSPPKITNQVPPMISSTRDLLKAKDEATSVCDTIVGPKSPPARPITNPVDDLHCLLKSHSETSNFQMSSNLSYKPCSDWKTNAVINTAEISIKVEEPEVDFVQHSGELRSIGSDDSVDASSAHYRENQKAADETVAIRIEPINMQGKIPEKNIHGYSQLNLKTEIHYDIDENRYVVVGKSQLLEKEKVTEAEQSFEENAYGKSDIICDCPTKNETSIEFRNCHDQTNSFLEGSCSSKQYEGRHSSTSNVLDVLSSEHYPPTFSSLQQFESKRKTEISANKLNTEFNPPRQAASFKYPSVRPIGSEYTANGQDNCLPAPVEGFIESSTNEHLIDYCNLSYSDRRTESANLELREEFQRYLKDVEKLGHGSQFRRMMTRYLLQNLESMSVNIFNIPLLFKSEEHRPTDGVWSNTPRFEHPYKFQSEEHRPLGGVWSNTPRFEHPYKFQSEEHRPTDGVWSNTPRFEHPYKRGRFNHDNPSVSRRKTSSPYFSSERGLLNSSANVKPANNSKRKQKVISNKMHRSKWNKNRGDEQNMFEHL